jgi:hypothetical protein
MLQIKQLAPSITHAIKAVEQGCRKIQDDPDFVPEMWTYMTIDGTSCLGCLATSTLLQLTNNSAKQIVKRFSPHDRRSDKFPLDRAAAYGIELDKSNITMSDFFYFETSIDSLRHSELMPLLEFYEMENHQFACEADEWLYHHQTYTLGINTTKADLLKYADFLAGQFIPKLELWFSDK